MDDAEAIRRLKRGDMRGLEPLVSRYQVRAVRTAFLVTHDEALAQDIVQETYIRIVHHIQRFDDSRPFEPYLVRSVVNASLNALRHERKNATLGGRADEVASLLARAASVESQVEFSQLKQEILTALTRLTPRQRAAIVQRYYLEMSEAEMALAMDVAPGTIKWLLNAARKRLRGLLASRRSRE
jgi:RNA polymerase sigma-70 factor (ECF subfamily)